jgi:hypothetical protein
MRKNIRRDQSEIPYRAWQVVARQAFAMSLNDAVNGLAESRMVNS